MFLRSGDSKSLFFGFWERNSIISRFPVAPFPVRSRFFHTSLRTVVLPSSVSSPWVSSKVSETVVCNDSSYTLTTGNLSQLTSTRAKKLRLCIQKQSEGGKCRRFEKLFWELIKAQETGVSRGMPCCFSSRHLSPSKRPNGYLEPFADATCFCWAGGSLK